MIIDLGSGPWPKPDADVHVDFNDYQHVEIKHDLLNFPYPFPDFYADKIYLHDVIEHINVFEVGKVIWQCARILKMGGTLDIVCPDMDWIAQRLVNKDWKERAQGDWLNKFPSDFCNAMQYVFGGFYSREECNQKGMGHVAGYNADHLIHTLQYSIAPLEWASIKQIQDPRNECILRVLAVK